MDTSSFAQVRSQSPQTGQFNSYKEIIWYTKCFLKSQSPQTGQFNSYEDNNKKI